MHRIMKNIYFYIKIAWLYITGKRTGSAGYSRDYDIVSATYQDLWIKNMSVYTKELAAGVKFENGYRMLDLGCGTGFMITEALKRAKPELITGVDNSAKMLTKAGKLIKSQKVCLIKADMMDFLRKEKTGSYDIVTCCWALPYVDAKKAIREAARILKPGGQLAVITNRQGCVDTIVRAFIELMKIHPEKINEISDMQYRLVKNAQHLEKIFGQCGIKLITGLDKEQSFYFKSGRDAMEWEKKCGSIAGSFGIMKIQDFGVEMAEILEDKYMQKGMIKITHRFCTGTGIKC